jgi:hypothetical protein
VSTIALEHDPQSPAAVAPATRGPTPEIFFRMMIWGSLAAITFAAMVEGLSLRRWVWNNTEALRFVHDTGRQCYWALESSGPEGILNQYDKMDIETRDWDTFLDYVPLRLLVMQRWGVYLRHHFPETAQEQPADAWQPTYEFTAPLLHFNAFMDGLAAVCAFFLTRLWVRRAVQTPGHFTGVWQGSIAALLIWFNPAILLSAYAWPTWDNWIIPMYLLTALLASLDWWFCAGIALAIGAMLKGQQLAVAPVFILWPLVLGRVGAAARWCIGLLLGIAIIASPWQLSYIPSDLLAAARDVQDYTSAEQYPQNLFAIQRAIDVGAICWIVGILATTVGANWLRRWWWAIAITIIAAVAWPCALSGNRSYWPLGAIVGAVLALAAFRVSRGHQAYVVAAAIGAALLLSPALFHGSHSWWDCGFAFGSSRWHWIASSLTDNLPGLLYQRFGWSKDPDEVVWTLSAVQHHWPLFLQHWGWWPAADLDVTAKTLFNPMFTILLLVSGIAIGLQARRKSRRMLLAIVLPWIVFFMFPVEIMGRYMLYPAVISAICIGDGVGMALISILMTGIATTQILDDMMQSGDVGGWGAMLADRYPRLIGPNFADSLFRVLEGTHPDLTWALLIITGIFFYLSFTRARRGKLLGLG